MSALPLITSEEYASLEFGPRRFDSPADVLSQWLDFERLMYWHLYRIRLGAADARTDLMRLVRDMAAMAEKSNRLALAGIVLSLADILVRVGPFLTGLQMAEVKSILSTTNKINRQPWLRTYDGVRRSPATPTFAAIESYL
jgi:hypothetical protein